MAVVRDSALPRKARPNQYGMSHCRTILQAIAEWFELREFAKQLRLPPEQLPLAPTAALVDHASGLSIRFGNNGFQPTADDIIRITLGRDPVHSRREGDYEKALARLELNSIRPYVITELTRSATKGPEPRRFERAAPTWQQQEKHGRLNVRQ